MSPRAAPTLPLAGEEEPLLDRSRHLDRTLAPDGSGAAVRSKVMWLVTAASVAIMALWSFARSAGSPGEHAAERGPQPPPAAAPAAAPSDDVSTASSWPGDPDHVVLCFYVGLTAMWVLFLLATILSAPATCAPGSRFGRVFGYVQDYLLLLCQHKSVCSPGFRGAIQWQSVCTWLPEHLDWFERDCTKTDPCDINYKPGNRATALVDWNKYITDDPLGVGGLRVWSDQEAPAHGRGGELLEQGTVVAINRKGHLKICWDKIHIGEFEPKDYPVQYWDVCPRKSAATPHSPLTPTARTAPGAKKTDPDAQSAETCKPHCTCRLVLLSEKVKKEDKAKRTVAEDNMGLRLMPHAPRSEMAPGVVIRHDTGKSQGDLREIGAAFHQRRTYLTKQHIAEDGVRHDAVMKLEPCYQVLLEVFTWLSVLMALTCIFLCVAVFRTAWEQTVLSALGEDEPPASEWTKYIPADEKNSIAGILLRHKMCDRYQEVPTPLVVSSVQSVVVNFLLVFFMGLPQKGLIDNDWKKIQCWRPGCCGRQGEQQPLLTGVLVWYKQKNMLFGILAVAVAALSFLQVLCRVWILYRAGDLGQGGWDSYQTALVLIYCNTGTSSYVQMLIRLWQGHTEKGSLQQWLLACGALFFFIVGIPAMLTHGLISFCIFFGTLVVFPIASPGLWFVDVYAPGALPDYLRPLEMAKGLRGFLASTGSLLLCVIAAVCIHSVLQYPVSLLWTASTFWYRENTQEKWYEKYKAGKKAIAKGEATRELPPLPNGMVVKIKEKVDGSTFYSDNNLLGCYAQHRGTYCGEEPIWEFDTGRSISMPFEWEKGPHCDRVSDPADYCKVLNCNWQFARWSRAIFTSAKAVALAVTASFVLQSSVIYMVFMLSQWKGGLGAVPEEDFNVRSVLHWLSCHHP
eukprot:TRINITY_DN70115_c0_g1_i1.p1 TRINITY_DN70115_c0_g1~~TRINITY_DN70115_c0_g1_i1.p1  ORF type:complete len:937 (+),score=127.93 TRINITY_DN70115_c0_g1_i1:90-2813(+)